MYYYYSILISRSKYARKLVGRSGSTSITPLVKTGQVTTLLIVVLVFILNTHDMYPRNVSDGLGRTLSPCQQHSPAMASAHATYYYHTITRVQGCTDHTGHTYRYDSYDVTLTLMA